MKQPRDRSAGDRPLRVKRTSSQPVRRLLMATFALVAALPLAILGWKMYDLAWQDAWREINEKHRLIAANLAHPISIYVNDHRASLSLLAQSLSNTLPATDTGNAERVLDQAVRHLPGFASLTLVGADGRIVYSTDSTAPAQDVFRQEGCFLRSRDTGQWAVSGIKASPLSGEPTIIASQPVWGDSDSPIAVVLGELRIGLIEQLRRSVHFGERGHSAIVDQFGRVIAHPNPDWMVEMRDLSHLGIIQAMMSGESGATEFYSPFVKQDMVAGYAAVPEIGWGIMVPQPKQEIERRVQALLWNQAAWGILGLVLALVLGGVLARWITKPLKRLEHDTRSLLDSDDLQPLPGVSPHAPREIRSLAHAFNRVLMSLKNSTQRYEDLNRSLQQRVDEATLDLRTANVQLETIASQDHLTNLSNRRHFEELLAKTLRARRTGDEILCLMLIDLDNFKQINDRFGHAAGDVVLKDLAGLLKAATREGDLVARYGGDEFVVRIVCDRAAARIRAAELRESIDRHTFQFGDHALAVTASIGLMCHDVGSNDTPEGVLNRIDAALYRAKQDGRNRVVEAAED